MTITYSSPGVVNTSASGINAVASVRFGTRSGYAMQSDRPRRWVSFAARGIYFYAGANNYPPSAADGSGNLTTGSTGSRTGYGGTAVIVTARGGGKTGVIARPVCQLPNPANIPNVTNPLPNVYRNATGVIQGQVQENGVPKARQLVRVYQRSQLGGPVNAYIKGGVTDANGNFVIRGLDPTINDYTLIAWDSAAGFNAKIYDQIQPVSQAVAAGNPTSLASLHYVPLAANAVNFDMWKQCWWQDLVYGNGVVNFGFSTSKGTTY